MLFYNGAKNLSDWHVLNIANTYWWLHEHENTTLAFEGPFFINETPQNASGWIIYFSTDLQQIHFPPPFFNSIHLHTTSVFGIFVHNVKYWLNFLEFSDLIHEIKSRYIYISNKMLLFSSFAFLNELYDTQPYRILKLNTFKMHINMN